MIKKENGQYVVYSESGRKFGSYPTEARAKKRLRQMEIFKHIKKTAYINKMIPKTLTMGKSLFVGMPDVQAAAEGSKYLYNFFGIGAKTRGAVALGAKKMRGGADKALAKKRGTKIHRIARTTAGRVVTEPDIAAAGIASSLQPIPGIHFAYIAARDKAVRGAKMMKKKMIKQAFKFNVKDTKKLFNLASEGQVAQGLIRQKPFRALIGLTPKKVKGTPARYQIIRELVTDMNSFGSGVAGTIVPTRFGTKILINKKIFKESPKVVRRNYLAHEAFHAKTPILGHSEIAAHIYGGWKATKKAPVTQKIKNSALMSRHLIQGRPIRAGLEVGTIGSTGYGVTKVKDKFTKKAMTLARVEKLNKIYDKNVGKTFIGTKDACNTRRIRIIKIAQSLYEPEQAATRVSSAQMQEIQPFIRGKDKYQYQRDRHIPTTKAIRLLSDEARFRNIVWPGGRDSYGPIIEMKKESKLSNKEYRVGTQYHIGTFNANAETKKSPYRARLSKDTFQGKSIIEIYNKKSNKSEKFYKVINSDNKGKEPALLFKRIEKK